MFEYLKKLFTSIPKVTEEFTFNEYLCERINEYKERIDLNHTAMNSLNRLIILNVYNEDFNYLLDRLLSKKTSGIVSAVSIEKFFKSVRGDINLNVFLVRIYEVTSTNEINIEAKKDIEEILNTFDYIFKKEEL